MYDVVVKVDKTDEYNVSTVKEKAYKSGRNIKYTALNTISLTPGKHQIEVSVNGSVVYSQLIFVSTGEHKIIEL
jgi:phosphatidate phosphatase PAH1